LQAALASQLIAQSPTPTAPSSLLTAPSCTPCAVPAPLQVLLRAPYCLPWEAWPGWPFLAGNWEVRPDKEVHISAFPASASNTFPLASKLSRWGPVLALALARDQDI
jgi:hypothetical protein